MSSMYNKLVDFYDTDPMVMQVDTVKHIRTCAASEVTPSLFDIRGIHLFTVGEPIGSIVAPAVDTAVARHFLPFPLTGLETEHECVVVREVSDSLLADLSVDGLYGEAALRSRLVLRYSHYIASLRKKP